MNEEDKDLEYWKNNAEEDYLHVPISVLRYITELEKATKEVSKIDCISHVSDLFEVGIEVKVTKRKHGHSFKIGEVVEVVEMEIYSDQVVWWCSNGIEKWCLEEDEVEAYNR